MWDRRSRSTRAARLAAPALILLVVLVGIGPDHVTGPATPPALAAGPTGLRKLEQKSRDITATRKLARRSEIDFAGRDIAGFWLLHTINSATAALRHELSKRAHPQELYTELLRLAGALCTFDRVADPQKLPLYDHNSPGVCFQ